MKRAKLSKKIFNSVYWFVVLNNIKKKIIKKRTGLENLIIVVIAICFVMM